MNKLEKILAKNRGWIRAKKLKQRFGISDRDARFLASESVKIISGDKGYKLASYASLDEVRLFCSRLRSQAQKMNDRAWNVKMFFCCKRL
jgi:hypothetical protein